MIYLYKNFLFYIFFFIFLLLSIAISTLLERKVMGSMQRRRGPNVVGFFGFLQPIADGLKLFLKEIVIPSDSNIFLFLFSPIFTFFCSIVLWFVIPFDVGVYLLDLPYSMLYILSISSFSIYGIIFSGWASNSKYAFLGGLRSTAQMISYEVCIGFLFIVIIMVSGSFNLTDIVNQQREIWFVFPLFPFWVIFFICALAETNRAPFDLPEAEAELVAGYNVEYSSIAFALFFLGEYGNILFMSALLSIFFFGGWWSFLNIPRWIFFGVKVSVHVFIFIWIRAAFPRYRYDQLMKLGWKVLMPLSVVFLYYVSFFLLMFFFFKVI